MPKVSSEVVKRYLSKFPHTPSYTLAKLIYKENSELFTSPEVVRSGIRYWRGKSGKDSKKKLSSNEFLQKYKGLPNPFGHLPKGIKYLSETQTVKLEGSKFLILSDIHAPYHDEEALKTALEYGQKQEIDHIILNGDICDCHAISSFQKDPREIDFQYEIDTTRDILSAIRTGFPKAKITFKLGNHEDREIRYLQTKAPELLGVEWLSFENLLGLDELNITLVGSLNPMKIGDHLYVIHGHEFGPISAPVNPARSYYMKAKECLIAGHLHRSSEHGEKSIKGKIVQCWSTGCLCDDKPLYAPNNQWTLGFATVDVKDSSFSVHNKKIINNNVV